MDWPTVVLILGVLGLVFVAVFGGRFKASKDGVEYVNEKGLLEWLGRAREQKGAPPPAAPESARAGHAAPPPPAQPDAQALGRQLGRGQVPRARILWVDDHPLNNLYERQALASLAIFADSYTTNAEGEAAMEAAGYDLVISDIARDNSDETGWDLLAVFRNRWPRVPFVFYAGHGAEDRRARAAREGARGVATLPDELISLVVDALSGTSPAVG